VTSVGDQKVSVAEVKKALANKQQFVQLDDGTLGIFRRMAEKYSLLLEWAKAVPIS
jgi:non-specific serine/threonine protein kinase